MKPKDTLITMLIVIILGQFLGFYLVFKKINSVEFQYVEKPPEVYIADLTQRLQDAEHLRSEIVWQAVWFSQHLGKCIEALEGKENLEPIPIKYPELPIKGFPQPDPNSTLKYFQAKPFFEPYKEPNIPSPEEAEERNVRYAICSLNLARHSLTMTKEKFDLLISNYGQRLKRLEEQLDL